MAKTGRLVKRPEVLELMVGLPMRVAYIRTTHNRKQSVLQVASRITIKRVPSGLGKPGEMVSADRLTYTVTCIGGLLARVCRCQLRCHLHGPIPEWSCLWAREHAGTKRELKKNGLQTSGGAWMLDMLVRRYSVTHPDDMKFSPLRRQLVGGQTTTYTNGPKTNLIPVLLARHDETTMRVSKL